jgi:hypothetical protein
MGTQMVKMNFGLQANVLVMMLEDCHNFKMID